MELARTDPIQKVLRYGLVSAIAVVITQVLLLIFYKAMGIEAWVSNVLAVAIASVPAYLLNRAWVWGQSGRNRVLKEVVPFWAFAFAGLVISTVFVHWVHDHTTWFVWIGVANLAGFGVLWVLRFLVFDRLIWKAEEEVVELFDHKHSDRDPDAPSAVSTRARS
jgi:putative flippase GtrA